MITKESLLAKLKSNYRSFDESKFFYGDSKRLSQETQVYFRHLRKKEDPWGYSEPQEAFSLFVYCKDLQCPTEVHKILQWLDKNDACDFYYVLPNANVYSEYKHTLYLPKELKEEAESRNYRNRWGDDWNSACRIMIFGKIAETVNDRVVSYEGMIELIKKELDK